MNKKYTAKQTRAMSVKRTLVLPDLHFQAPLNGGLVPASSCHDPDALSVALQIANDWNPDEIVQLGDLLEMETVSHWNKAKNRESQVQGRDTLWYDGHWKPQEEMGTTFWRYLHKRFPSAQKHQLEGNHDFWSLMPFAQGALSQFAEHSFRNWPVWKECGINFVPYDLTGGDKKDGAWVDVGDVRVLHGNGRTMAKMLEEHVSVMYGHTHKIAFMAKDNHSREFIRRGWNIGCLTHLNPIYCSTGGKQPGYAHGFGVIYTMPDGGFDVQQVFINDGRCINFNGKTYYAKPLSQTDKALKVLELP